MINQRFHFVAVVSVFLAVAVGLWIGLATGTGGTASGDRVEALRDDTQRLRDDIDELETEAAQSRDFAANVAPAMLEDTMDGERVLLVGVGGATGKQLDAMSTVLGYSSAEATGRLRFTKEFTAVGNGDALVDLAAKLTPPGAEPPNDNDGVETVSALLAMSMLDDEDVSASDRDRLIAALERLDMVAAGGKSPSKPATAVVIVSGEPAAGHVSNVVTVADRFSRAGPTVLASSRAAGTIDAVRSGTALDDRISTVDNVDTPQGSATAALALPGTIEGEIGHYGTGATANAVVPMP